MNADDFTALYDETARDLMGFLLRRTAGAEDAADCLAEIFAIAWDKRETLPIQRDQARPWLFGVARNVVRRGAERQRRASDAAIELQREMRSARSSEHDDDRVEAALRQLSTLDREIIEMLAWDQLAPREIAGILGLSPNAVRVRAHRARLTLRQQLGRQQTAPHDT